MQFVPESFNMPEVVVFDTHALLLAVVTLAIVLRVPTTIGFFLVKVLFAKLLGGRVPSVGTPTVKKPRVVIPGGGGGIGGGGASL